MTTTFQEATKIHKPVWINIIFFAITTLIGLIGGPLYIAHYGLGWQDIALFVFFTFASGMGITVGYHRLFAHSTYRTNPVVRFLLLFFGAAAFEQSALKWASQHRDHHQYVDTELDPYSIKRGFFYAHIGWLIFWDHKINYENAKDLQKDPLVMNQHKYWIVWAVASGILLPIAIGALFGHALGAFVLSVCARLTLVYHSTFCINSVCHMFGNATYDIHASAKDHWLVALLTFGEGYHNFHHRFPSDYRNGVRWYHWDPSKWLIGFWGKLGLAHHLMKVSEFRIVEARLAGENRRVSESLQDLSKDHPRFEAARQKFILLHKELRHKLITWEMAVREYQTTVRDNVSRHAHDMQKKAHQRVENAKIRFQEAHSQWQELINNHPLDLSKILLFNPSIA